MIIKSNQWSKVTRYERFRFCELPVRNAVGNVLGFSANILESHKVSVIPHLSHDGFCWSQLRRAHIKSPLPWFKCASVIVLFFVALFMSDTSTRFISIFTAWL